MDKPEFIHKGQLITDNAYYQWIENVKSRFHSTQAKAAIRVNTEMLRFYWSLGRDLVQMKAESTWGAGVLKQASMDLRASFPDAKGFSVSNLQFAKRWYLFYYNDLGKYYQVGNILSPTQDNAICCQVGNQFERSKLQQLVGDSEKENCSQAVSNIEMPKEFGRVPWRHHIEIITHCNSFDEALFYINETIKNNWSRHTLEDKIKANLYASCGSAITNFEERLPVDFAPKATAILKDPYILDFLELPDNYDEHEMEEALVKNVSKFLLELGNGFSYIGHQVELRMDDGTSFFPDLLFYNYRTKNFVVCELKVKKFIPEYVGKLNFYVKAVDMLLKGEDDNPTIGLLICREKNQTVVEWSLSDINKPLGVASYELQKKIEASLNSMLNAKFGNNEPNSTDSVG